MTTVAPQGYPQQQGAAPLAPGQPVAQPGAGLPPYGYQVQAPQGQAQPIMMAAPAVAYNPALNPAMNSAPITIVVRAGL